MYKKNNVLPIKNTKFRFMEKFSLNNVTKRIDDNVNLIYR